MLRLASRISALGVNASETYVKSGELIRRGIGMATCLIADEVSDFYEHVEKTHPSWIKAKDVFDGIPNWFPFADCMFVEWKTHEDEGCKQCGWFVTTAHNGDAGYTTLAQCVLMVPNGGVFLMPLHVNIEWSGNRIPGHPMIYGYEELPKDNLTQRVVGSVIIKFRKMMLSLALANCKNVVRRDVTETEGPSAKWLRRQKAPEIRYHVLDINPMKEVLRTEGDIEANGLKKALHICRGHFVTYTEERPLFGKITGTFWKPSHVRGSVEHGIVDKDYRIKIPASDTRPESAH